MKNITRRVMMITLVIMLVVLPATIASADYRLAGPDDVENPGFGQMSMEPLPGLYDPKESIINSVGDALIEFLERY